MEPHLAQLRFGGGGSARWRTVGSRRGPPRSEGPLSEGLERSKTSVSQPWELEDGWTSSRERNLFWYKC